MFEPGASTGRTKTRTAADRRAFIGNANDTVAVDTPLTEVQRRGDAKEGSEGLDHRLTVTEFVRGATTELRPPFLTKISSPTA